MVVLAVVQELRAKAEAESHLRDDSDVDQKVSDAMTTAGTAQPSSSSTNTAAAGYGTIPNGLPSGNDPLYVSLDTHVK